MAYEYIRNYLEEMYRNLRRTPVDVTESISSYHEPSFTETFRRDMFINRMDQGSTTTYPRYPYSCRDRSRSPYERTTSDEERRLMNQLYDKDRKIEELELKVRDLERTLEALFKR